MARLHWIDDHAHRRAGFGLAGIPDRRPATDTIEVVTTLSWTRRWTAASSVGGEIPPHASTTTCTR